MIFEGMRTIRTGHLTVVIPFLLVCLIIILVVLNSEKLRRSAHEKDWTVTLVLAIFFGNFGIDRFYTGHIGLGILKLITGGGAGIWWLIDIILILTNNYNDIDGNPLVKR